MVIGSWFELGTMMLGLVLPFLFILILVKVFRGGSKRREDPDTRAEVDDLRELADRVEKRVENLETILTDRAHTGHTTPGPNAEHRSDVS